MRNNVNKKIAIIGMGHMGKAINDGLVVAGVKKENILVSNSSEDNKKVAAQADWIVLAVKPFVISDVITDLKNCLDEKIVISVAAGVTVASMVNACGNTKQKIIRLMPNLPIAYGQGVIGFFANDSVLDEEKEKVMKVLSGLGTVIDCKKEEHVDAMTILSGSGPAVVAYCLSLFEQAGKSFGFDAENARQIAYQTFVGTLSYLKQTGQTAGELQQAVATKGGVTEQIINSLEEEKVSGSFQKSFEKGYARIKEIRQKLDNH